MLDSTLQVLLVTLVVQGLKAIGINISDNTAKIVALLVAGLFLVANGLVDAFVPVEFKPLVQQVIDLVKAVLTLLAPAGVYGYVKMLKR